MARGEEQQKLYDPFLDWERRAAEVEREEEMTRREEEEKARKDAERRQRGAKHRAVLNSILERDPKTGQEVYTRYSFTDFSIFDIDEESRIPPMRFTKTEYLRGLNLEDSANIISVRIVSSDRAFPINVYGTVIARDSVDHKCIYIFNRPMEDCQTISSVDESLILTGPGRGLVLLDFIYLEMNLKVKCDGKPLGEQISKGLISIDGRVQPRDEKVNVGSRILKSWYSSVEVSYATILNAVEGTFEIELLKGHICGEIKAGIEGVQEKIVIYDSKEDGVEETRGDRKVIKLRRHVMTICLDRMLMFEFVTKGCRLCGGAPNKATSKRKEKFTPQRRCPSEEEAKVTWGAAKATSEGKGTVTARSPSEEEAEVNQGAAKATSEGIETSTSQRRRSEEGAKVTCGAAKATSEGKETVTPQSPSEEEAKVTWGAAKATSEGKGTVTPRSPSEEEAEVNQGAAKATSEGIETSTSQRRSEEGAKLTCGAAKATSEGKETVTPQSPSEEEAKVNQGAAKATSEGIERSTPQRPSEEEAKVTCGAAKATSKRKETITLETFTPQRRGQEETEVTCAAAKLQVKVVWSMMDIVGRSPVVA